MAVIGGLALIGWATGSTLLKAGASGFIPMAPNTALLFAALGLAVVALDTALRAGARFARGAAILALAVSGTRLADT